MTNAKTAFSVVLLATLLVIGGCGGDTRLTPGVDAGDRDGSATDAGDRDGSATDGGDRDGSAADGAAVDGSLTDADVAGCGDGVLAATGEACDDGNTSSDDGCDSSCAVEAGFTCDTADPSICTAICGDGLVRAAEAGMTGCDDGNTAAGDGCDASCQVEAGFSCSGDPSACTPGCGDGLLVGTEECDDGAMVGGDGCSSACVLESGWTCTGAPSACATVCGDSLVAGAEACDDGNTSIGDGCGASCVLESSWTCAGVPSVCTGICGDGLFTSAFDCDDGNTIGGDGCSATCAFESGWTCTGSPSVCMTTCGDGLVAGSETCDDGGSTSGNGCSAMCTVEAGFVCMGSPSVCSTTCGDGLVGGSESCDDGGSTSGNGCSATCTVEAGYVCVGSPSVCTTTCGDGLVGGSETCDDGGSTSGNGCSAMCTVEAGFICVGSPSVCAPPCGDGIRAGAEGCDDGGGAAGDGCSATCTVEAGYVCVGTPSVCTPTCGDGVQAGSETCDDGNTTAGDCCSATCSRETRIPIDGGAGTAFCEFEPNSTAAAGLAGGTYSMNGYLAGGVRPTLDADFFPIVVTRTVNLRVETFGPANSTTCGAGSVPDTLLDLYAADGTTILASDDDDGINNCSLISPAVDAGTRDLAPGTYYVRVRGFGAPTIALYTVGISACGDGVITGPETCDDGFTQSGDGCSASCAVEPGFTCMGATSVCSYIANYLGASIAVPDNGAAVDLPVTVALPACRVRTVSTTHLWRVNHTYVGDLVLSVVGPTTATTVLSNRVGTDPGRDLGGPYTFATGGSVWPPATTTSPIPAGTYGASYSAFVGTPANGTWTFRAQDFAGGDTGSLGSFSVTLTCFPEVTTVVFPSATSTVSNPSGTASTTLLPASAGQYSAGDYVQQAFTRANTPMTGLDLNLQMTDTTGGCALGAPLAWNVLVNGAVVGTFGFTAGSGLSPRTIAQSYSFTGVPPGPVTVRLQATSTVCGGGGAWNWVAGGTTTLR